MPIEISDAWADDGVTRRNKFRKGVDRLHLVCSFYISKDLADSSATVNFDFTHIDWRNNHIWHDIYSPRFNPGDEGWWYVWIDHGICGWSPAWNWLQVIADVDGLDQIAISPERFLQIVP